MSLRNTEAIKFGLINCPDVVAPNIQTDKTDSIHLLVVELWHSYQERLSQHSYPFGIPKAVAVG